MKKQLFLVLAGGLTVFSACNTEVNEPNDAQIDSMVNARVEEYKLELMRTNDSTINVLAWERADSIIAAMKGANSVTTKTTTTKTTTVNNPKPTIGNGKPAMGDKNAPSGTIGTGKPAMGDKNTENTKTIGTGKPKMGDK